jgi:hypothetical protein
MALLTKNRKLLEKLAKILLEKEVVEGHELDALLGIKPPKASKAPKSADPAKGGGPTPTAPAVIGGGLPQPNPA